MTRRNINIERITKIAKAPKHLNSRIAFVGGAVVQFLISDPAAPAVRPTTDVDAIVDVSCTSEFAKFELSLRELKFKNATDSEVICRYIFDDLEVDFMPISEERLGFNNRWYKVALATANDHQLENDLSIKLISAPCFIATKLEAFFNRGENDFRSSHDLQDIINVIDGREELFNEIKDTDNTLRIYLRDTFSSLLRNTTFLEIFPGIYCPTTQANNEFQ